MTQIVQFLTILYINISFKNSKKKNTQFSNEEWFSYFDTMTNYRVKSFNFLIVFHILVLRDATGVMPKYQLNK